MAISCLGGIRVNNKSIVQTIDTSSDTVYFKVDGKVLLSADSSGYVTKTGQEKYIGKFSLLKKLWVFCFFNDNFVSVNDCDKITTPMYDLTGAEMLVVKELIKRNVLEV